MPLGMIQVSPCDSLHCFSLLPFTDHASGHTSLSVALADKTLQSPSPTLLQNNSLRMCMLLRKRRAKMCSLLRVLQRWRASAQCVHRDMVCKRCSAHTQPSPLARGLCHESGHCHLFSSPEQRDLKASSTIATQPAEGKLLQSLSGHLHTARPRDVQMHPHNTHLFVINRVRRRHPI